jgi:hypothetical protein
VTALTAAVLVRKGGRRRASRQAQGSEAHARFNQAVLAVPGPVAMVIGEWADSVAERAATAIYTQPACNYSWWSARIGMRPGLDEFDSRTRRSIAN